MTEQERDELFERLIDLSSAQIINTFASVYGHLSYRARKDDKAAIEILHLIDERVSEHEGPILPE